MADICLADTWIKSGLIGQNVCQGSAIHLSCIGVDYNHYNEYNGFNDFNDYKDYNDFHDGEDNESDGSIK